MKFSLSGIVCLKENITTICSLSLEMEDWGMVDIEGVFPTNNQNFCGCCICLYDCNFNMVESKEYTQTIDKNFNLNKTIELLYIKSETIIKKWLEGCNAVSQVSFYNDFSNGIMKIYKSIYENKGEYIPSQFYNDIEINKMVMELEKTFCKSYTVEFV